MTAGWAGSHMAAGDVAWRAWNRLGVNAWDHMLNEAPGPAILDELGVSMAPQLDRITRLVLDELEVRLYGEARERVVASVQSGMVHHAMSAVNDAIVRELQRPDPIPFNPPSAGTWIRSRWLPRPAIARLSAREATWRGRWHAFSGDLHTHPYRINEVYGRTACGVLVALRSEILAAVVVEAMPGVDVCGRCRKIARAESVPA